jgi:hypothetical protein
MNDENKEMEKEDEEGGSAHWSIFLRSVSIMNESCVTTHHKNGTAHLERLAGPGLAAKKERG